MRLQLKISSSLSCHAVPPAGWEHPVTLITDGLGGSGLEPNKVAHVRGVVEAGLKGYEVVSKQKANACARLFVLLCLSLVHEFERASLSRFSCTRKAVCVHICMHVSVSSMDLVLTEGVIPLF